MVPIYVLCDMQDVFVVFVVFRVASKCYFTDDDQRRSKALIISIDVIRNKKFLSHLDGTILLFS